MLNLIIISMMKTKLILFLILSIFCHIKVYAADQTVSAILSGGGGGGGGGVNPGGIIAGGVVGGAATGASALAFAPILLAGLKPNSVICAAAPLDCIAPLSCYLQEAIKYHGNIKISAGQFDKVKNRYYFAQNDCDISNGAYDVDEITLPDELKAATSLKIDVTIVSQAYKENDGEPEFIFGIYKDISRLNLNKKFETQQFLHQYMMKKYEIPLKITCNKYEQGLQKLSGTINMAKIKDKDQPLKIVVRYTQDGFKKNLMRNEPKTLTYAYIVEIEKLK